MDESLQRALVKDFQEVLDTLSRPQAALSRRDLFQLSDLTRREVAQLEAVWQDVPVDSRRQLMEDMGELAEDNLEMTFEAVSRMALEDEDGLVRARAIQNLWEVENPNLIAPLLRVMQHDPSTEARAAAAAGLGNFTYLAALEKLPEAHSQRIDEALVGVATGPDSVDVRRRAVESLGYSGREEVPAIIGAAYRADDEHLRASALLAMGRTADARWSPQVLAELRSPSAELRYEAAGELELGQAVEPLIELLRDSNRAVRDASTSSLGQVGGERARQALTKLLARHAGDADLIQDALDNLEFNTDLREFTLPQFRLV